ncbi:sensor histidine kinase [Dyadobacter sp. Leaf189]|uniref:sensor histidine kinase n=1 Tax=Dyadobacter sp. Leaf189 TaxID=1736295 RepID=UPI000B015BC1|nr:histidine kinase [Dyadobacter sp. Leaf189]
MSGESSVKGSKAFWNFSPAFFATNVLIALGILVFTCPSCVLDTENWRESADDFLISFLMSSLLSYGGFLSDRFFDKRLPWIQYPVKRLFVEYSAYAAYVFVASFIVIFSHLLFVKQAFTLNAIPWGKLVGYTRFPMQLSLVISFLLMSRSFLLEWRKAAIETEKLKTERFAQQYQSLKDQLNPHFLFNSLNVLSNLVYENQETAARFIQQLSRIYRYVLDVQHEELVTLGQELEFAKNYLSLQKIRFEENLDYRIHIDEDQKGLLPPLSLQLLLENAIKHNIASTENPLRIDIYLENEFLVVKNNLQLKSRITEESTGIGLSNISKRYELLSQQPVSVRNGEGYFVVKLPLLKIDLPR